MDGEVRRSKIVKILEKNDKPISATKLAEKFSVSRQIIVGDIALLRATGKDILSTPRGYIFNREYKYGYVGIICVKHSLDDTEKELNTIVDYGGTCIDIFVKHDLYGEIIKPINISSRYEVKKFLKKLKSEKPLSFLTDGVHFHRIGVENEKIFKMIEEELKEYLLAEY